MTTTQPARPVIVIPAFEPGPGLEPLVLEGHRTSLMTVALPGAGLGPLDCQVWGSNNSRATNTINAITSQPFTDPQLACTSGPVDRAPAMRRVSRRSTSASCNLPTAASSRSRSSGIDDHRK